MTSSRKSVDIVEKSQLKADLPVFSQGDTVLVDYLVKEGTRERSQPFEGVVIGIKNRGLNSSFIVRKTFIAFFAKLNIYFRKFFHILTKR